MKKTYNKLVKVLCLLLDHFTASFPCGNFALLRYRSVGIGRDAMKKAPVSKGKAECLVEL